MVILVWNILMKYAMADWWGLISDYPGINPAHAPLGNGWTRLNGFITLLVWDQSLVVTRWDVLLIQKHQNNCITSDTYMFSIYCIMLGMY